MRFGPQDTGFNKDTCRAACSMFKFFSLQGKGFCSCDDEYGTPASKYPAIDKSNCDKK